MNCRKDAVLKGMIAGIATGMVSALAVGYGVAKICSGSSQLKRNAKKALKTVKNYINGII